MNQALPVSSFSASSFSLFRGLKACIGISALLISPALANVNGPGTSPSNAFDTVLNLPGDETVITGAFFETIGGIMGQTTQLNLNDGGTLGDAFTVDAGAELNISGGNVGEGLAVLDGGEINISGGDIDIFFETTTNTVVNITGGNIGNDFINAFGGVVNISGGNIGDNFFVLFDGVVNFSGGTIGDDFFLTDGGVLNISGGSVGDNFSATFGGVVNLSGGTIGNNFSVTSGSDLDIFGSEFFIDGVALDTLLADQPFTITDRTGTLSGVLLDGQQFSIDLASIGTFSSTLDVTLVVPEPSSAALITLALAAGFTRRRRS